MNGIHRRRFLIGTGAVLGGTLTAGCLGDDEEPDPTGDPAPDHVDDFLAGHDTQLYDGTIDDRTGQDAITIDNGEGDQGYAFSPPAVLIDAGTDVTWEWTGRGGSHNVVSVDESDFEFQNDGDGELIATEGHTWSYTFEESGTAFYHCTAHAAMGQYGAIVVE